MMYCRYADMEKVFNIPWILNLPFQMFLKRRGI